MTDIQRKGDAQEYDAEPHQGDPDKGVEPKVTLLWMTEDPLGAVAAMSSIYSGRVVRSLGEITDDDRYQALIDVQKTHLKAPLESVKLHFLLEGVDRAFTHQLVRQRTAVYAQESMRFATLGNLLDATTLPPSLAGTERTKHSVVDEFASNEQKMRMEWDRVIMDIDFAYHKLLDMGMPAEEARGLLPHATATRIHFITDLRNLSDHAGNRLCTQAQFHWRQVFSQMVQQIRIYNVVNPKSARDHHAWQFEALASSGLFRPVCYQLGHCPFTASFDRACSIRDRVQAFAKHGVSSDKWEQNLPQRTETEDGYTYEVKVPAINPAEWLLRPDAARL